ncbi:MAG: hypothetical protein Q8N05_00195 [Bacteroidota bacterium]|nr:hypothetical protein [Bacteroidota bacterium]
MKNNQRTSKPNNRLTNMIMQLLHWMSHLILSGIVGEKNIDQLMPASSTAVLLNGNKRIKNKSIKENKMKPNNRLTKLIRQLLHWISHLELSRGYVGEKDIGRLMPHPAFSGSTIGNKEFYNQHKNENTMKSKNQILKGLALIYLLVINGIGSMAQGPVGLPEKGDHTVCFGEIKNYGVNLTSDTTYGWTITSIAGGNGTIANGATPNLISINWTSAGTAKLELTETNGTSCLVTVSIVVTILPQLTAPAIASAQTICYGATPDPLTMPTLPTGGNGTYTYQWQGSPDGSTWTNIGGATGISYAPSALTATTSYQVIATATGVQTCGVVPTSNVVTITLLSQAIAPAIASAQTICYGATPDPLTMPTLPTGGNGTYTYQWQSSPDGLTWTNIGGATGSSYAPSALTATTSYQVITTATGVQTCGVVPTSNVVTITVNPLPTPAITGIDPICGGNIETYSTPDSGNSFFWTVSGGTITGQGAREITVTWNPTLVITSGTVSVEETIAATGCKAIDSKNIVVNPKPTTDTIWHD